MTYSFFVINYLSLTNNFSDNELHLLSFLTVMTLKKLLNFFTFNMEEKYDSEVVDNVFIINVFTLTGSVFCVLYAIIAIVQQLYGLVIVLALSLIAILFNFLYLKYTKNIRFSSVFAVTFLAFMVSSFLFVSTFQNASYLWFYILPPISLTVLGFRRGTQVAAIPLFFALLLFFIPPVKHYYPEYQLVFELRFLSVYIFIYIISAFILYRKKRKIGEFENLYLEADNSTRTKTEVILHLSHHIRTTLNSIVGLMPMIRNSNLDSERKEYINTVGNIVNTLVKEVDEINNLLESGVNSRYEEVYFSLYETISRFISIYQQTEFENKTDFNIHFPDSLKLYFYGNPNLITKLFYNVCETVRIHSSTKPGIDIRLYIKQEFVTEAEIIFEFSTKSIAASSLKSLKNSDLFGYFDGIDRKNESVASDYHYLYNLSISKQILKNYRGDIGVRKMGDEVIFWFSMMLAKSMDKPENYSGLKQKFEQAVTGPLVNARINQLSDSIILVAEDNTTNLQVLLFGIKNKVNEIVVASNGNQALEHFYKRKFHLVLLDLEMPGSDGFEVISKIREIESGTPVHTPVIAITAFVSRDMKEKCVAAGFDDYIGKPYRINELIDLMEKTIKKFFTDSV